MNVVMRLFMMDFRFDHFLTSVPMLLLLQDAI